MVYKVIPAVPVARDLELIEDYLSQAYQGFGEDAERATSGAALRITEALDYMDSFANHPYRGTEHPKIRSGVRSVTHNRFVYYFEIDEPSSEVIILAVFFGGIDHKRRLLDRLKH